MRGALIFHLTYFMSTPYLVKRRYSKLLHNAVIASIRLLAFAHICFINSTEGATRFDNFMVLNILSLNILRCKKISSDFACQNGFFNGG